MSAVIAFDEVVRLDGELVRLSRGVAAIRLRVGEVLEALVASGGHQELGFSSRAAYAPERLERPGRWAADTCALARRVAGFPRIKEALRDGEINWSMAELLARSATAETEIEWLERARNTTIREMRAFLRDQRKKKIAKDSGVTESDDEERLDLWPDLEEVPARLLTVTATLEDGWLFECARKVAEQIEGKATTDTLVRSLLAEGLSTLIESTPEDRRDEIHGLEALEEIVEAERKAQAEWCAQRERWRIEAEALCRTTSPELRTTVQAGALKSPQPAGEGASETPEALDRELRRLCSELAERDLELGMLAERAHRSEVWLRLGFASEVHYARERLGLSLSSLNSKRVLAARAARLPALVTALSSGGIGYEAAYLVSRVATRTTVLAWLERARERTVKHLREDVDAAELFVRLGYGREQWPPDDATMEQLFELERRIASGELCTGSESSISVASTEAVATEQVFDNVGDHAVGPTSDQMSGGPPEKVGAGGDQMSGGPFEIFAAASRGPTRLERSFACVTYRWHVSSDTYRFWRALERAFIRVRSAICIEPVSYLHFLCDNFCRTWLPAIRQGRLTNAGAEPAYFRIYRRDAFRCTSPVCPRRDVGPHHLEFRSAGGGDEDENLTSLCFWCHLRGIHEGRVRADPPASRIRWRIGRNATVRVEGRKRVWDSFREQPGAGTLS